MIASTCQQQNFETKMYHHCLLYHCSHSRTKWQPPFIFTLTHMHSMKISLIELKHVECDVFQMYTEAAHVPIPGCVGWDFHLLALFTKSFSRKFMVQLYYCALTFVMLSRCSHSLRVNLSLLVSRCLNLEFFMIFFERPLSTSTFK